MALSEIDRLGIIKLVVNTHVMIEMTQHRYKITASEYAYVYSVTIY